MRILVVVASKHGATAEIADAIVDELRIGGHEARRMAPEQVRSLAGIDAVVLGSAVYMTQWMEPARSFVHRWGGELGHLPVWAFSSGLARLTSGRVPEPEGAAALLRRVAPTEHATFAGRLDPGLLGLRERVMVRAGGATEGDYRDWTAVRAWARAIAAELTEHLTVG